MENTLESKIMKGSYSSNDRREEQLAFLYKTDKINRHWEDLVP